MTSGDDVAIDRAAKPSFQGSVEIQFRNWRSDLPLGHSLVVPGGGLVNNGFPALSADRKRIAVFYHARHPLEDGYPTLEIYSTSSLRLQKRIDFFPEHQRFIEERRRDPDLSDPDLLARVERRVVDVNRMLAEEGYRSMAMLYDTQESRRPVTGFEISGMKIDYPGTDASLVIASSETDHVELKLKMPVIPVISGSEDPLNDCEVQGDAGQAWYEPEGRIIVVRMAFNSARDGCELPEQWLVRRLQ